MITKRTLTKSRFKLGLECPTKLYYTKKKKEYADKSIDDSFLLSLAEGGFQVGELAKFNFSDDPIKDKITVESLDYEQSINDTNNRIESGEKVIAEAAIAFEDLFIRVDVFVIDTEKKEINIHEVKAKSYDKDTDFWSRSRGKEKKIIRKLC